EKLNRDIETEEYKEAAKKNELLKENKEKIPLQPLVDMVPDNLIIALGDGKLMLQVIFFALFFGISMILIPRDKTEGVRSFFDGMNEVFIKMVQIVMRAAPFFVFCLMAGILAKSADSLDGLITIFMQMGMYALVVFGGLALLL